MSYQHPYNRPRMTCECGHFVTDHTTGAATSCTLCSCAQYRVPPLFVAIGAVVMRGRVRVCTAESTTMAQRIARALNLHKPNSRGI